MKSIKRTLVVSAFAAISTLSAPIMAAGTPESLYVAKCQGCHGVDGGAPIMPYYPKLKGQNEAYLLKSFEAYRNGQRTGDQAVIMKGIVASVGDEDVKKSRNGSHRKSDLTNALSLIVKPSETMFSGAFWIQIVKTSVVNSKNWGVAFA